MSRQTSFIAFVWAALLLLGAVQSQAPTQEPAVDAVEVEDSRETERDPTPLDEPHETTPCVTYAGSRLACLAATGSSITAAPETAGLLILRDGPARLPGPHVHQLVGRSPPILR